MSDLGGAGGFNRDQIDDAILKARAAAEPEPEKPDNTVAVDCTGCGRSMKVIEDRVPRPVEPISGVKVRNIGTGQSKWYCSTECFYTTRQQ